MISVEITKQQEKNKQRQKGPSREEAIVKGWELGFAFKLDFLQLIYKASLILKSNLELAWSAIF